MPSSIPESDIKRVNRPDTPFRSAVRIFRRNRSAMVGLVIVCGFLSMAATARWLAPHDPQAIDARAPEAPPWTHVPAESEEPGGGEMFYALGTDELGRGTCDSDRL